MTAEAEKLQRYLREVDPKRGLSARDLTEYTAAVLLATAKVSIDHDQTQARHLIQAACTALPDLNSANRASSLIQKLSAASDWPLRTNVAVISNSTLKPLCDGLRLYLFSQQVTADVWEAPFDQWQTQLLDPNSDLATRNPGFVVLYLSSLGLTSAGTTSYSLELANEAVECWDVFSKRSSAQLIVILPEPLEEEQNSSSHFFVERFSFIRVLRERMNSRVHFVEPDQVVLSGGGQPFRAPRYWYHAKLPLHPNALVILGRLAGVIAARCLTQPIKVLACDLDDTLWGGVIGEEGWQNVHLDVHAEGGPFLRLQAFLKELSARGMLLVAVSKNNEQDVRELFAKRSEMILKWDDFVMVVANWELKSSNLMMIAKTLNLGLEQFCFIDNSPFERAEVRNSLAAVHVPELPQNPEDYVPFLVSTGLFQIPVTTAEDVERGKLYRAEAARSEAERLSPDPDSFLRGLGLSVYPERIGQSNLERVVQLINKTNQFNLTTRRYDTAKVAEMAAQDSTFAFAYRVTDKFGDHGLTGVMIALPHGEGGRYFIDTWLMSCRVMGRTVERAMFEHIVSWLRDQGASVLEGEYIPSAKNAPVASLLSGLGFTNTHKNIYEFQLSGCYIGNTFVRLSI